MLLKSAAIDDACQFIERPRASVVRSSVLTRALSNVAADEEEEDDEKDGFEVLDIPIRGLGNRVPTRLCVHPES